MADLNIPNLNKNSNKYIFKKKFKLKRKSKRSLSIEAFVMFILSLILIYVNYLIPNKNLLLEKLPNTLNKSLILSIELVSKLFDVFIVLFIFTSLIIAFILLVGSFYRVIRIAKRKEKIINYK